MKVNSISLNTHSLRFGDALSTKQEQKYFFDIFLVLRLLFTNTDV